MATLLQTEDIRRINLKNRFSEDPDSKINPKEKSYIAQLLSRKVTFRERTARRIERDYGIAHFVLDNMDLAAFNRKPTAKNRGNFLMLGERIL